MNKVYLSVYINSVTICKLKEFRSLSKLLIYLFKKDFGLGQILMNLNKFHSEELCR